MVEYRELYTWNDYHRNCEELKGMNWNELSRCVRFIHEFEKIIPIEYREKIEEELPTVTDNTFNPGGWVGTYPVGDICLRVVPKPELLSKEQFKEIMNELIGWLEYVGPFLENFLKFCSYEPIFNLLLCEAYSRYLVEYTEIALSHFIPREMSFREYISYELRGKPLWNKIVFLRARDPNILTYNKIEFILETLLNLLLVRFHADLLKEMKRLVETLAYREESVPEALQGWRNYMLYHEDFISSPLWSALLGKSMEIDFESFEILERTRRMAKDMWSEVVDLWESYRAKKALFSGFGNRFDNAIKPLSKVYELWCFKKLCDLFGIDRRSIREFPFKGEFKFADKMLRLYYNTKEGLSKYSGIMRKIPGVSPGIPDFVLEDTEEKKIVCIMDAKCKSELKTEDINRFLAYMLDYIYPCNDKMTGLIFYISREEKIMSVEVKNVRIYLIPLIPPFYPQMISEIKFIIEKSLS
ncbi:MAG: hypothetical protein QXD33_04845 [Nitrososphaerota archaeon]